MPTASFVAVDEALQHPYLAPLHNLNDEPVSASPFSFDFEQPTFNEENIRELIWRESLLFNPNQWQGYKLHVSFSLRYKLHVRVAIQSLVICSADTVTGDESWCWWMSVASYNNLKSVSSLFHVHLEGTFSVDFSFRRLACRSGIWWLLVECMYN